MRSISSRNSTSGRGASSEARRTSCRPTSVPEKRSRIDTIHRVNAESGVTVLLVEQNAVAALEVAHTGYLIEQGRIVMSGTAEALQANPDIQQAYLGGGEQTDYHAVKHYRRRRRWLA